jgi:hypothetical protein
MGEQVRRILDLEETLQRLLDHHDGATALGNCRECIPSYGESIRPNAAVVAARALLVSRLAEPEKEES